MKKTQPAGATQEPTPSYESYHQVTTLILNRDVPEFDPGLLASTLLLALEREGEALSDKAYMAIMRVAACLKKQCFDEVTTDHQAREVVRKARAAR